MAGNVIDSLLVSLGFKVDPKGLEGFAKQVEHVKHVAEAVFGFEVVKRVGEFVERSVEAAAHIQDTAEAYDLSATKMAAMGRVAVANSVSMEAMSDAYAGVSRMAGQAALGVGRGAKLFQALGLSAKDATGKAKSGLEVMGDVAEKMSKLSTTERLAMASRLGIDPLLARKMSEMGRAGFLRHVAEAEGRGLLTEHDYEIADQTEIAFNQLHGTIRQFVALVAIQLGPTVKEVVKEFTAWVRTNREIIVQKTREYFDKVREILSKVVDVAKEVAKHGIAIKVALGLIIASKLGNAVSGWLGPLGHLVGSLGKGAAMAELLKAGFSGIKMVIAGGLLAALGLVIEDLWTFYQGGDSVTGWMLQGFPFAVETMKTAIAGLSGALIGLTAGSGPLGLIVAGIGGLIVIATELREAWNPLMQWFSEAWNGVTDDVKRFVNYVLGPLRTAAEFFGVDIPKFDVKDGAGEMPSGDTTGGQLGFEARMARFNARTNRGLGPLIDGGGNMLTWGPGVAAAGAAGGIVTTTINETNGPTTINVNGAGNPKEVAAEVAREQERRRQLARQATRDAQAGHR